MSRLAQANFRSWRTFLTLFLIGVLRKNTTGFSPSSVPITYRSFIKFQSRQHQQRLHLALAPIVDAANIIPLILTPNDFIQSASASAPLVQATVSQLVLYASSNAAILKPAAGHSQPLWGPPDPYLSAGRSIPPSTKGLADIGVTQQSLTDLPEPVQATVKAGYRVLDAATIKAESILPGFSPVGGILPAHNPLIPLETPATFAAQVAWSAKFLNVVDKLPEAAFMYALIEFFILRPGIDLYKEDIELQQEEGPTGVLTAETLAVTGVRVGVFFIVAIFTNIIFG